MLSLAFLTLIVVGASSSPVANQYFDTLINTALANEVRWAGLEPASLTNFTTEFEDKVKFIGKVKGKAEFFNGTLTGMSQAKRFSECQGPYFSFGSKNYNCTIGLDRLSIVYDGKLKYGKVPKLSIKGKANSTSPTLLFVEVTQNANAMPSVKGFNFQQIGTLKVDFSKLGPLNKFTGFLEDGFKGHVQAEVFNSMSQRYQGAFSRAVSQVPLPM